MDNQIINRGNINQVILALVFMATGRFAPLPDFLGLDAGVVLLMLAGILFILNI